MPTSLSDTQAIPDEDTPGARYEYRASLIGSAHRFELTDTGLAWKIGGRSGVWAYGDIASIRLTFRPVSMQARRFRADIIATGGRRIRILSTTWQTATLMAPQDRGYRAFIRELHRRMAAAGSRAVLAGGIGRLTFLTAVAMVSLLGIAMAGLLLRAVVTGEWVGALFLVGFGALFVWQIGGFIRRNRPRGYRFDHLPEALLP